MSLASKLSQRIILAQRCTRSLSNPNHASIQSQSRWASSLPPAFPPPNTKPPPTLKNVGVAAFLVAFVGSVFFYSMNAVGKGDESALEGGDADPLAQLKAEAQEARSANKHNRRLSPEEIEALESGVTANFDKDVQVEVAVAAPADIAQREEEANLKVMKRKQGEGDKPKKSWWRFGF